MREHDIDFINRYIQKHGVKYLPPSLSPVARGSKPSILQLGEYFTGFPNTRRFCLLCGRTISEGWIVNMMGMNTNGVDNVYLGDAQLCADPEVCFDGYIEAADFQKSVADEYALMAWRRVRTHEWACEHNIAHHNRLAHGCDGCCKRPDFPKEP